MKNITRFEELYDEDRYMDFSKNLINVFEYLKESNLLQDKKQKYLFWVSKVYGTEHNPYRDAKERVRTIRVLLKYWKWTFGKPFSLKVLEEVKESRGFDAEAFEAQARKNSAWGAYGAYVRQQNEIREYKEAEKLPEKEREKELNRLKNRPNQLVIG
jgi:hypothetical protein